MFAAYEDEETQEILSDKEIVELIQQPDPEESQLEPGEIIDIPSPHLSLSTKNQICVLAQTIALIDDSSAE
jgi:hypothetical protein